MKALVTIGVLASLFPLAPSCKKEESPQRRGAVAAPVAPPLAGASPKVAPAKDAAVPAGPSGAVTAAAKKAAAECKLSTTAFTYRCAAFQVAKQEVAKALRKPKLAGKVADALSLLLGDSDEKVAKIGAWLLGTSKAIGAFRQLKRNPSQLSPATVDRLIEGLRKARAWEAVRLAQAVTYAASLTHKLPALFAASKAHPEEKMAPVVIRHVMTYARMEGFGAVQAAAKSEKQNMRRAALGAPLKMYRWTDEEREKICPWALGYFKDKDLAVAGSVAQLMVRCKGKYIEEMLKEGKRRVAAGQWKKPFVWAYRDICFRGFLGTSKIPSDDVCQKAYRFLEWVANHKKVDNWYRGWALGMIAYQQRNEKTYKVLKKYRKSKIKELREFATKEMKTLKTHYMKKK